MADLARRAVLEKEEVSKIIWEFRPAFKAATQTARMTVGIHLPTLYKAKQSIDSIKTSFCGSYTESARSYIDYGIKGMEAFLGNSDTLAGTYLGLANKAQESLDTPTSCSNDLTRVGILEANERLNRVSKKRSDDDTLINTAVARLEVVKKFLGQSDELTKGAERDLIAAREVTEEATKERDVVRATWEAEASILVTERKKIEDGLRLKYEEAKKSYEQATATITKDIAALKSPTAEKPKDVSAKLEAAKKTLAKAEGELLNELVSTEIAGRLSLNVSVEKPYGSRLNYCTFVQNNSSLAIRALTIVFTINGRRIPEKISFFPNFHDKLDLNRGEMPTHAYGSPRSFRLAFVSFNKYSETVPYLMPGKRSNTVCASLDELFRGENLRILEANGLDKAMPSQIGGFISVPEVADPNSEKRTKGRVEYSQVSLSRYSRKLDELRNAAANIGFDDAAERQKGATSKTKK